MSHPQGEKEGAMWKIPLFLLSTSASAHLPTDSLDLTLVGEDQNSQDRNSNVVPSENLSSNSSEAGEEIEVAENSTITSIKKQQGLAKRVFVTSLAFEESGEGTKQEENRLIFLDFKINED